MKVSASELVPGDLVRLYIGDRVPADMRIIECSDLKVNNITGLHICCQPHVVRRDEWVTTLHHIAWNIILAIDWTHYICELHSSYKWHHCQVSPS